jgi:hypothetical protein
MPPRYRTPRRLSRHRVPDALTSFHHAPTSSAHASAIDGASMVSALTRGHAIQKAQTPKARMKTRTTTAISNGHQPGSLSRSGIATWVIEFLWDTLMLVLLVLRSRAYCPPDKCCARQQRRAGRLRDDFRKAATRFQLK